MRKMGILGILFLLFWAIPFPMIIYYHDPYRALEGGSGPLTLLFLGISILLSATVLYKLFYWLVSGRFIAIRMLNNLMQNGELKIAKIIQNTPMTPEFQGVDKSRLKLELQNFVGTTIHETMDINDSTPALHSFDVGKTIKVRIDKSLKNMPYLQMDGAHYKGPNIRGLVIGSVIWLVCAAIVAWYFLYSYQHESNDAGWRFLVWYHPLIICPLILMGIIYFFGRSGLTRNQLQHKYYGYETEAQVIATSQNGVYINDQPQVRFDLQFTDRNQKVVNASFTRTIGILDTAMVQQKTMDIFYLENEPQNICLASDLE